MTRRDHLLYCFNTLKGSGTSPEGIRLFLEEYNQMDYIQELWKRKEEDKISKFDAGYMMCSTYIAFFVAALLDGIGKRENVGTTVAWFIMRRFFRSPKIKPEEIERLLLLQ